MNELTGKELDLVCGGQSNELRTVQCHDIPRFDSPSSGLTHELHRLAEPPGDRAPAPIPLHWLPPRDDLPQVF